jgi:hypothetical protein
MKAGARAAGGVSKGIGSGNRVGIAAMGLIGSHRNALDAQMGVEALEVLGSDDLGIDTESAKHGDIGAQSSEIGCVNYGSKAGGHKTAYATDDIGPIPEISEALESEGGLGREGIMHPDESAGEGGHPGAYFTPIEDINYRARPREVHCQTASDYAGADDDHSDAAASVRRAHIF